MKRACDIAILLFFAASAFLFPRFSFADTLSTGWTWSMACPVYGDSADTGNFSSTQTSGFTGSGSCQRANNFTEVSFTASSGATLRSTNYFAVQTPGVLILPPVTTADQQPIFMVATACPGSPATLNWIFVQWDSVGSNALTNTYVLGTATYSSGAGVNVTSQFDVTGAAYWLGTSPMPGTCSSGIYNVTATGDLAGTIFFNSSGQGVFKTGLGHATFFFPQYTVTLSSDLGNKTSIGMTFDSTSGTDSRNVQVTSNAAGTIFSVQLLSNPATGTIDNTYADTITVSQVNTPVNGMLLGTVTRTGAGAGSGQIACIVNNSSVGVETICSGQSPSASTTPYNISFTHLVAPPTMVSINVTPASPTIPNGLGQQLSATAVFSDSSIENVTSSVTWSTNASGIATANSTGYVSSVALGSATITATLGSISGTASVTVGSPVLVSVLITPSTSSLYNNETTYSSAVGVMSDGSQSALIPGSIVWTTSNSSEVTVDSSGNVVAAGIGSGSANITATYGSVDGSVTISDLGIDTTPSRAGNPFPFSASMVSGSASNFMCSDFEAVSQTWTTSALVPIFY